MRYIIILMIMLNLAITSTYADEGWALWERIKVFDTTEWKVIAGEITFEQCKQQKNEKVKLAEKNLKKLRNSVVSVNGDTVSYLDGELAVNYRCLPGLASVTVEQCAKEVCAARLYCTFDAYVSSEGKVKMVGTDSERWKFEKCLDQQKGM